VASRELCHALLAEAGTVVVRRVSTEEVDTMANSWYRAFQRTAATDLEKAFEAWFDAVGERRVDTLPTSGAIQVHLTAMITARSGAAVEPTQWTPAREEFRAAHRGFRAQVQTACRMRLKMPHVHAKGVPSPEHMTGCPECARIDEVQDLVAELLAELPEPLPLSPRRCTCFDASGYVQEQGGEGRWYPCRKCRPDAFARWVGGDNDNETDGEPKRLALAGGKRKRR
jgi:hypothetical protein